MNELIRDGWIYFKDYYENDYSYKQALEAAGAQVLEFEQFGSYQGEWYALVKIDNKTRIIEGSY